MKIKTFQAVGMTDMHNRREYETVPEHIDMARIKDNQFEAKDGDRLVDALNKRLDELDIKPRKNGVLAVEYVMTASNHIFNTYDAEMYLDQCKEFIEYRHGKENILSVAKHFDESNPHIHVVVVPIDKRGKLNCREFLGGPKKMRDLQEGFYQYMTMGDPFSTDPRYGKHRYEMEERDKKRKGEPEKYIDRTSHVLGNLRGELGRVRDKIREEHLKLTLSLKNGELEKVKGWVKQMEEENREKLRDLEKRAEEAKKVMEKEKPRENRMDGPMEKKPTEPPLSPNNPDVLRANVVPPPQKTKPPVPKIEQERQEEKENGQESAPQIKGPEKEKKIDRGLSR